MLPPQHFSFELSMFLNNTKSNFSVILQINLNYHNKLKFALDKHFEAGATLIWALFCVKGTSNYNVFFFMPTSRLPDL